MRWLDAMSMPAGCPLREVRAVEVHLCNSLYSCRLAHLLHHRSRPALSPQVSTANLERVRKVKTRHQRLMARVATVREELERFLEDDDDMMKMCLSRRKEVRRPQPHPLVVPRGLCPKERRRYLSPDTGLSSHTCYASC